MLIIRLQRIGKKHDPSFRLVLVDSRKAAKTGAFLEILGSYNPRQDNPQLKADRIQHWLSKGVKTSGTVYNLLVDAKIVKGPKVDVSPSAPKKGGEKTEAPAGTFPEGAVEESAPTEVAKEVEAGQQEKTETSKAQEVKTETAAVDGESASGAGEKEVVGESVQPQKAEEEKLAETTIKNQSERETEKPADN